MSTKRSKSKVAPAPAAGSPKARRSKSGGDSSSLSKEEKKLLKPYNYGSPFARLFQGKDPTGKTKVVTESGVESSMFPFRSARVLNHPTELGVESSMIPAHVFSSLPD